MLVCHQFTSIAGKYTGENLILGGKDHICDVTAEKWPVFAPWPPLWLSTLGILLWIIIAKENKEKGVTAIYLDGFNRSTLLHQKWGEFRISQPFYSSLFDIATLAIKSLNNESHIGAGLSMKWEVPKGTDKWPTITRYVKVENANIIYGWKA